MNALSWQDLKIRLRPDIQWSRMSNRSDANWVARDPISLDCFYFSDLEKSIATQLDGRASLLEVLSSRRHQAVSKQWLLRLVTKLERACLTTPRAGGRTGSQLAHAKQRSKKLSMLQALSSPLAVRLKLLDPNRILVFLTPIAQFLFSRTIVVLSLLTVALVGITVLLKLLKTPWLQYEPLTYLTAQGALILFVTYAIVKSLHELGHALACRKWGCECHEIGVFFLALMPCLYCDTTDSWKLPGWRRACIAAAGIYVELLLAALAGFLWLISPDFTQLHIIAAYTMLICSLNTLLVNGNPLLRYDGYYILSDLWGVPNLHQQSREAMQAVVTWWLTGRPVPQDQWNASSWRLAVYGFAALIYRHFVVLMIAWFVWKLLENIGFSLLGGVLVLTTFFSLVLAWAVGFFQIAKRLFKIGEIHVLRTGIACACLALAGYAFVSVPMPTFVVARGVTRYQHMSAIYAEHSGTLKNAAQMGSVVRAGTKIALLDSAPLKLEILKTSGEVDALEQRSMQLNMLSIDVKSAFTELATIGEQLADAKDRLRILQAEFDTLNVLADTDGVVLPKYDRFEPTLSERPDQSPRRAVPITSRIGSFIPRGTHLAWICKPREFVIKALVVEHDAELIELGMPVRCRWDCKLSEVRQGTVTAIASEPISEIPSALVGDRSVAVELNTQQELRPVQPHYEVTISLDNQYDDIVHQNLATVHIDIPDRTLQQTLLEFFNRNVRAEL